MQLKDLEPVSARLCLRIEKICRERFCLKPGAKALLAISGGADSLALALIFHIIAPRLGITVSGAHINHMLRKEADSEAEFTASFCRDLDLPCSLLRANVADLAAQKRLGLEEAGREARLSLLRNEAAKLNADYILLAHHREDLAEDILMRLTRGAGWPGLGGMSWQNGPFLRPLLHTAPQELRDMLLACGFSWKEDPSNQSLDFMRNRFRHVVLPLLRCENPSISRNLEKLHDQASLDEDYWQKTLAAALEENPWQSGTREGRDYLLLPEKLLKSLHPAARLRLLHMSLKHFRRLCSKSGQSRADILERLERAWASGQKGKTIECGCGICAVCLKQGIELRNVSRA